MKTFATIVLFALASLGAHAAAFSLNPTADAFVTSGSPANNYGGAGSIALSAPGLPQGELQSLLQFNLAGALSSFNTTFGVGQWSIQSVSLQLTASAPNNGVFNASAGGLLGFSWMQNDSWTEGSGTPAAPGASGITFNTLPTFTGAGDESLGAFSFNGATSGSFTYSLGLTPGFTADLIAGNNLSLRLFATDSVVSGVFNSRSFGTASSRPLLNIVAVPEPGTFMLAGLGVVFIGGCRWLRGRK